MGANLCSSSIMVETTGISIITIPVIKDKDITIMTDTITSMLRIRVAAMTIEITSINLIHGRQEISSQPPIIITNNSSNRIIARLEKPWWKKSRPALIAKFNTIKESRFTL